MEEAFPFVRTTGEDIGEPARQSIVFAALHPPVLKAELPRIGEALGPDVLFVSLAPVIRIPALQEALGRRTQVARMIPNAPTVVGRGFNPIAFAPDFPDATQASVRRWLSVLGECPVVPDAQLEAFAILTAMGPTYFWFQFEELERLGGELGLDRATVTHALSRMLEGGVETYFTSGMSPESVVDLVPVKPLAGVEDDVRAAYRTALRGLYAKLVGSGEPVAPGP